MSGDYLGDTLSQNQEPVLFYEREFYVLSNFSAFAIECNGKLWPTSEHLYHSFKFENNMMKEDIRAAKSAHDALKLSRFYKEHIIPDWDNRKLDIMEQILRLKVNQHPYVKKKLLETGGRELIEDSHRDSFWGWGADKDGQNNLGKLWMKIRKELNEALQH